VKAPNGYPIHNLDTGLNYTSIQNAINANETFNGHTIFVESGIYYEHVVVNKSLSLIGENKGTTVIDGKGSGTVVEIKANSVTLGGFTVRNGSSHFGGASIMIYSARNVLVEDCLIKDTFVGVYMVVSGNNILQNNIITNSSEGIYLLKAENNSLIENVVASNYWGVGLADSGNNTLRNNEISNSICNFGVWGKTLRHFINDVDTSNTINGKTVYYLTNKKALDIDPYTFPNLGYLAIVNSSQVKIENLKVADNFQGVLLAYTDNSELAHLNLANNWHGIDLCTSNNNTLSANKIVKSGCGIWMSSSSNNRIVGNILTNDGQGVLLDNSNDNTFKANTLTGSVRGIYLPSSSIGNLFCHNNFINNSVHVEVVQTNSWNDYIEGNYWDNYNGTDSDYDGIGDASYILAPNNTDNYPLMGIFHSFNTSLAEHVNVISNSTVESFEYFESNSTIMMHVSNMTANQTSGFCRLTIPHDVLSPPYTVMIGYGIITHTTIFENDTLGVIYFSYPHSEFDIIIIPEFPSLIILPLFMIVSVLVITIQRVMKRKRHRL